MGQNTHVDWTGQPIYIGLDIHQGHWEVSIHTQSVEHKTFHQDPEADQLVRYLHRHFPGATSHAVYEAGYCGFAPYRALTALGVDCLVVHPPDVPTTDKQRRRKTDRTDARTLAQDLRAGLLVGIYVPTRAAEAARDLVRWRATLRQEQTRTKNRITSLLQRWEVAVPAGCQGPWSQAGLDALATVEVGPAAATTTVQYQGRLLRTLRQQEAAVRRELRALAATDAYRAQVALLQTIPGIGFISALTWLTELGPIDRFARFDQLCSYVGLVPGEHASGQEADRSTGLDHRGNPRLRRLLIQNSWTAVRKDPALTQRFDTLTARMPKQQAIIRIARKLLRRLRHVLRTEEPYATGVVASPDQGSPDQ